MKLSKILNPLIGATIALVAVSGAAHANETNAHEAHATTTKVRQVSYQCQSGKKLTIRYGFNRQNLPTYAQANIDGKSRFMPINLARSDSMDTVFGDENSYSLMTETMTLRNYHKLHLSGVTNAAAEFTHKGCKPKSFKRIKG